MLFSYPLFTLIKKNTPYHIPEMHPADLKSNLGDELNQLSKNIGQLLKRS